MSITMNERDTGVNITESIMFNIGQDARLDNTVVAEINNILAFECTSETVKLINKELCIVDENGNIVSQMTLLPIEQKCLMFKNSNPMHEIGISTFKHYKLLEPIFLKYTQIKKFDVFYDTWGLSNNFDCVDDANNASLNILFKLAKYTIKHDVYCYVGWNMSYDKYILGNLLVTANGIDRVDNEVIKEKIDYAEASDEDVGLFLRDCFFKVTNDSSYSITIFLFNLLSIIYPKLVNYSNTVPQFGLAIIGSTGTRKTSTVMSMINPIDMPTCSFEDTEKSLVDSLKQTCCGCLIIDDLNVTSTSKTGKMESIIRLVGDKNTQAKKIVGGKVDNSTIANLCVFTGEAMPNLQPSSISRVLVLNYAKDTVNLEMLSNLTQNKSTVITILAYFLKKFMQSDNVCSNFCDKVIASRASLSKEFADELIHGRYVDMYAWLVIMWEYICDCFKEYNVDFNYDYKEKIKDIIYSQHMLYKKEPVPMFLTGMQELIDTNKLIIGDEALFKSGVDIDIVDYEECRFIISGTVYQKVVKYYKREKNVNFTCSEKRLREELVKNNLIKLCTDKSKKYTTELRKGNRRKSGFYLLYNLSKKYL